MRWLSRIAYGTGQMLKDLVAGVISIFYIIFYEGCINLSSSQVGALLLFGQIANGLATPLIGYLSDRPIKLINNNKSTSDHQIITSDKEYSEKNKTFLHRMKRQLRLGQRKSWHLGGCLLMLIAFPLMFGQPEYLVHLPIWAKLLINGIFMVCVQVGWAAVQIPHLSIINDLTDHHDERVLLASLRYFFSGIGDMSTLLVTYLFFESEKSEFSLHQIKNITDNIVSSSNYIKNIDNNSQTTLITIKNPIVTEQLSFTNNSILNQSISVKQQQQQSILHSEYKITIQDLPIFRNVALIVAGIGVFFTIIFHCGIRESKTKLMQTMSNHYHENAADKFSRDNDATIIKNAVDISQVKSTRKRTYSLSSTLPWYAWFTLPRFWLSCCTFSIMRLSVTVSVLYMGPFLLNSLKMNKSSMVSVPLVTTIFCLITSVGVQRVTKLLGNYIGPIVGIPFILGFCTIAYFLKSANDNLLIIYFAAAILGIGNTINSVRALVVITSLIGVKQVHTAAFVHGVASLFDKILTGLFIQCIQLCIPQLTYRHIQVYIIGSLAIFGGILATIGNCVYNESVKCSVNTSCLTCICHKTSSSSLLSPSSLLKCNQSYNKSSNFNMEINNYTNSNDNEDNNNGKC
ncbi:hypothetical protein MN116_004655 [Schistosoma mekongi]|uniref:Major facilitator superfamily domain-containing protein 12 n=1 Tax=Schistosoma mekongi TaxID=38744 RepID=A0AAE2D5S8_SCHME|nr:hypothetical protein MN116_004655 [Schistosoma mekongi]